MMWTIFCDMHTGGTLKEGYAYICIEAPEEQARAVFYSRFGRDPDTMVDADDGPDYEIDTGEDVEGLLSRYSGGHYRAEDVLMIRAADITAEDRGALTYP